MGSTKFRRRSIRRREWLRVLGAGCGVAVTDGPLQAKNQDLRIYLARHGESEANAAQIIAGWRDSPLTPKGRQQAHDLLEALESVVPLSAAPCATNDVGYRPRTPSGNKRPGITGAEGAILAWELDNETECNTSDGREAN